MFFTMNSKKLQNLVFLLHNPCKNGRKKYYLIMNSARKHNADVAYRFFANY